MVWFTKKRLDQPGPSNRSLLHAIERLEQEDPGLIDAFLSQHSGGFETNRFVILRTPLNENEFLGLARNHLHTEILEQVQGTLASVFHELDIRSPAPHLMAIYQALWRRVVNGYAGRVATTPDDARSRIDAIYQQMEDGHRTPAQTLTLLLFQERKTTLQYIDDDLLGGSALWVGGFLLTRMPPTAQEFFGMAPGTLGPLLEPAIEIYGAEMARLGENIITNWMVDLYRILTQYAESSAGLLDIQSGNYAELFAPDDQDDLP